MTDNSLSVSITARTGTAQYDLAHYSIVAIDVNVTAALDSCIYISFWLLPTMTLFVLHRLTAALVYIIRST
jgi:hypothetical protein